MRIRNTEYRYELFKKVLAILNGYKGDGYPEMTFTRDNSADGCDSFINFKTYPETVCTFLPDGTVLFNGAEPLDIVDCPNCFYESIILNAEKAE